MNFFLQVLFSVFGLTNLIILLDIHPLYLGSILSLISLLILPGVLIFIVLRIKPTSFWETASFIAGLSISFIIFGGLLINLLLPKLGVTHPLRPLPVLISFDLLLL